ncbi:MAG: hypothetical protein ACN6OP_06395 [Pseudomonadales bacterium]
MPIVFVHAVNNRDSAAYQENETGRNGFLREIGGTSLLGNRQMRRSTAPTGASTVRTSHGTCSCCPTPTTPSRPSVALTSMALKVRRSAASPG